MIHSSFVIRHSSFRRGSAFIMTLWVLAALTGLALVLGHTVRIELLAASNRLAAAQAEAAEKGAEQFVLSAVDMEIASPGAASTEDMQANMGGDGGFQIGDALVWIIKPDPDDETAIAYGLTDEAGKIDLNLARTNHLLALPNMTQDIVDAITDWKDTDSIPTNQGAEDSYYSSLPMPYRCKNANFETIDELLLIKGIDATILYGSDKTRSGHVDESGTGVMSTVGMNVSNRGIAPFVTVYGVKAGTIPPTNTSTTSGQSSTATRTVNVNQHTTQLQNILQQNLGQSRGNDVYSATERDDFVTTFQWAVAVRLTSAEFSKVLHSLTATPVSGGQGQQANTQPTLKINFNTAPGPVLIALGLEQSDVDAIATHRRNDPNPDDPADISWLLDVITDRQKQNLIAPNVAWSSSCFSADILVSSLDGRAFKRTRIVVDASTGTSQIIYRRDLTPFGWPIDPQIRTALRQGKYLNSLPSTTGAPR